VARKSKRRIETPNTAIIDHPNRLNEIVSRLRIRWVPPGLNLSMLATLWFFFALLEFLLLIVIPGSAVRSDRLPPGARFLLIFHSLAILTLFLTVVSASLKLVTWFVKRCVPARVGSQLIVNAPANILTWCVVLFYVASWAMFWQLGSFIDSQVLFFLTPNPIQVFHWVDADVALAVFTLTFAVTFIVRSWIPHRIARCASTVQSRLVFVWLGALTFCFLGAAIGLLYSGWGERIYVRSGILYAKSHDNASGPFSYILADIRRYIQKQPEEFSDIKNTGIQIIERPIVSIDQYLGSAASGKINRWNVVVLIVESLRADQLRAYGATRDVMPTVDALAREGQVFLNTYTQSSHTNYATIVPLSSHYPLRSATSHTYPERPKYPRVLIYDVLKALGYRTAIFSSSNEYWGGMINYLQTGNLDRFIHAANFKGPTYLMQGDAGFAAWVRETKHAGSVDDRVTVDEAIQWIDSLGSETFFASINLQNSHLPYPIPLDFQRRFGPPKLDFTIRFAHFPKEKSEIVKNVYADSLAYVDAQIARLFQYLKRHGLWEQTVIVLTGDHGQAFYEHGFASHASAIYNEVMRVPLIIRAPQLAPRLDNRPAQHVDIPPSVLGLLGLQPHPSFQGINLFGSQPNPNRSIYMIAQTPDAYQYGIIRSGFKLIYDERKQEYLLYDLTSDPGENSDIADSRPALAKELTHRLHTWRKLQIDYYSDTGLQGRAYPPILAE
jgi:arylsulfatase A-like enzyme